MNRIGDYEKSVERGEVVVIKYVTNKGQVDSSVEEMYHNKIWDYIKDLDIEMQELRDEVKSLREDVDRLEKLEGSLGKCNCGCNDE